MHHAPCLSMHVTWWLIMGTLQRAPASWLACSSRGDGEKSLAAQVMVIPISEASVGYAQKVRAMLRAARLHVEVDASDKKMQKKVREAQLAQFNYILVRGPLSCFP